MRGLWSPEVEPSVEEQRILSRCKKAKLFVFLRQIRHELFDDAFQRELCRTLPKSESKVGRPPVPPAMLAMVTLLQAALGVSDEDAVEFAEMDRRWQMLLGTLGQEVAPFSQGTLFNFRQRLIAHDLDRRLLERTVEFAKARTTFSAKALRAAFDASPLFGAGRVEDTFNLIGHAARDVLRTAAKRLGVTVPEMAEKAGIPLLTGSSLKAALDVDWDDPAQKKEALERLLQQVESLTAFVKKELAEDATQPPLSEQLAVVQSLISQDLEPDPSGGMRIRRGTAKERQVSVRDAAMRHGRKSRSTRFDGYKRHIAQDLDRTLVLSVAVTAGNRPEAEATKELVADLTRQGLDISDLYIDRGYLSAPEIPVLRAAGTEVHCKAFPLRNHGRFTKANFSLDLAAGQVTCPAGQTTDAKPGAIAHFPAKVCAPCQMRPRCTTGTHGRSLSIHREEAFLVELRARQRTREGRADLRRRTPVEHGLAGISRSQGRKARYTGLRKNLFDLRRHAAVLNLHAAARA